MRCKPVLGVGATLLSVVTLAACGTAAGQTSGEATATPSQATSASGGSAGSTAVPKPAQTIAQKSGFADSDANFEIYSLKRSGEIVTMEFGVAPKSEPIAIRNGLSQDDSDDDVSGVYLVDTKNKKKYLPAKYGDTCLCSSELYQNNSADAGQVVYLYATYAALPDDVQSADVTVPHLGTLRDVPVS